MRAAADAMRAARWIALAAALVVAACHDQPAGAVDADGDGVVSTSDCDDSNAAVHEWVTAYVDADGDGVGAGQALRFCTDGLVPAGHSPVGTDCAPDDPGAWRAVPSPLVDADGDGYTASAGTTACVGETLPPPFAGTSRGPDCDDADATAYRWTSLYPDRDGDGVGACPRSAAWACVGAALPAGFAGVGCDVDDGDPAIAANPADAAALAIVLD